MIAIDCHTHIYPGTEPLSALIAGGVRLLGAAECTNCALLLCDVAGHDVFDQILGGNVDHCRSVGHGSWHVEPTTEAESISIVGPENERIVIVRGQQIVTSERLEVLAIGHCGRLPGGRSLPATIENARAKDCHVILPWGAGKWLGRRGSLIDHAVDHLSFPGLHLGDNGGRPSVWAVPQFTKATKRKIKILCGSDPLPITGDERRIGTYGSVFRGDVNMTGPWSSIRRLLEDPLEVPDTIGSPMNIWNFARSQAMLRVKGQ